MDTQLLCTFAKKNELDSIVNKIYGVSASLCCGVPPKIGTTYSKVIVNQDFIKSKSKTLDQKLDEL